MAWVLGLLFTDGTIRAKVDSAPARLSFTQKSPELLTKVQQLMQSTARIYSQPRRVYNGRTAGAVFSFGFCNARICERLFELGLTPRKSLVMRFPDVPRDCLRHFIRGCWDGDGTVHTTPDRQRVVAKFGSGSEVFVSGMLEALYREEFPARRVYQLKRHGSPVNYFYFAFQRPSHTHQLYRFLYDAVEKEAYLERKHHVFREYFERVGCEPLVTRFS